MFTQPKPSPCGVVSFVIISILLWAGCSDGDSGQPDADVQTSPDTRVNDVATDLAPTGAERFAGIWVKEKTGAAALVVRNDCGEYWRVDFDYAYSQLTPISKTTLLLRHCADAACTETDSSTSTLSIADDAAVEVKREDLQATADCTIQTESSTTLTLEAAGRCSMRWRAALTYVGSGCAQFKPKQTQGDSCEAIAQTSVTHLD